MSFQDLFPEYGSRGRDEGLGAIAEVLEVAGTSFVLGALEQRYGEEKTTAFMEDQMQADGVTPMPKDANGNVPKKSGTGIPYSAIGGVLGIVATVAMPRMTMKTRRHVLNFSTGLLSAFTYRKGIEKGQSWLDSTQPAGTPKLEAPMPPFGSSASARAEIANVKGEDDMPDNVASFDREADRVLAQRRAGR